MRYTGNIDTPAALSGEKRFPFSGCHVKRTSTNRIIWNDELQRRFEAAVEKLGRKSVPSKILLEMNVFGLTRDNVSSHLQKHRRQTKGDSKYMTTEKEDFDSSPDQLYLSRGAAQQQTTKELSSYFPEETVNKARKEGNYQRNEASYIVKREITKREQVFLQQQNLPSDDHLHLSPTPNAPTEVNAFPNIANIGNDGASPSWVLPPPQIHAPTLSRCDNMISSLCPSISSTSYQMNIYLH